MNAGEAARDEESNYAGAAHHDDDDDDAGRYYAPKTQYLMISFTRMRTLEDFHFSSSLMPVAQYREHTQSYRQPWFHILNPAKNSSQHCFMLLPYSVLGMFF